MEKEEGKTSGETFFAASQLARLHDALSIAEELVGDHYRLSSIRQDIGHYDVVTAVEHGSKTMVPGVLAEVVHCSRLESLPPWSERLRAFFRVQVYDSQVLECAGRLLKLGISLDDILLQVMIHELVHVVRFSRFLGRFNADPGQVVAEESIVESETGQILNRVAGGRPGLRKLLDHGLLGNG